MVQFSHPCGLDQVLRASEVSLQAPVGTSPSWLSHSHPHESRRSDCLTLCFTLGMFVPGVSPPPSSETLVPGDNSSIPKTANRLVWGVRHDQGWLHSLTSGPECGLLIHCLLADPGQAAALPESQFLHV